MIGFRAESRLEFGQWVGFKARFRIGSSAECNKAGVRNWSTSASLRQTAASKSARRAPRVGRFGAPTPSLPYMPWVIIARESDFTVLVMDDAVRRLQHAREISIDLDEGQLYLCRSALERVKAAIRADRGVAAPLLRRIRGDIDFHRFQRHVVAGGVRFPAEIGVLASDVELPGDVPHALADSGLQAPPAAAGPCRQRTFSVPKLRKLFAIDEWIRQDGACEVG